MRQRDESKIEAIYKATLQLVREKGLAGTTMCDISKAASLATGTLYIYFSNKEELIRELFRKCRRHSEEHYFAGLPEGAAFEERLQKVFENVVKYKTAYFEVSVFIEQSYHSPFGCLADLKKKDQVLLPLFALIQEGINEKKIRKIDEDLVVSFMFGIINEMVKKAYFTKAKLTRAAVSDLYRLFWNGIKEAA